MLVFETAGAALRGCLVKGCVGAPLWKPKWVVLGLKALKRDD